MALAFVLAAHATAQVPAAAGGATPPMPPEELAKLVGPIALYPDDLVGIILPAATNPLQLVQADRYLDKRKADPKLPVDERWDDPVKSLLNYPDVVKMMSTDLDWTTALGEAVVADQGAVIEAVQAFRRKAQAAGYLKSDDKQVVKVEQEIVYIQPADPQVIYVPQYNPQVVVVPSPAPVYAYYPTPYPVYYYPYPPGAAFAAGVIWGAAIGAAWSGNRYGCCGDTNINVNRSTSISSSNVNRASGARQQPAGGTAWKSNKQPGQVSGSVGKAGTNNRAGYGSGGGAGRASAQPTSAGRGGGDAFGGYGSGRQAQMDSSRGASSRGSMASASPMSSGGGARSASGAGSARSAPSAGGARGGGGGGRGGGGRGGGGRR
jgi:hypothetical protein